MVNILNSAIDEFKQSEKIYQYQVKLIYVRSDYHLEIIEWLNENMGYEWYRNKNSRYQYQYFGKWGFKSKDDAILFAMRWT